MRDFIDKIGLPLGILLLTVLFVNKSCQLENTRQENTHLKSRLTSIQDSLNALPDSIYIQLDGTSPDSAFILTKTMRWYRYYPKGNPPKSFK